MPRKFKRNLSLVKLFEVDTDGSGDISPDELRDLADDLEDKPLTGQKLRDALISDISDMHKDIYGMRPRAEFNKMSTEELEKIHDKIDQEHRDWHYEERVQDDLEDLAMARGLDDESIEDLSEPEEGEDMPKQMGMGRRRMKEGTMKITKNQLRRIIKEEISRVVEGEVIDLPDPKLPWEFGPQGYIARPELRQKMSDLEYGSDSAPEDILAIALSNRAEEMLGYKQTVDPAPFQQLGMRLYQDFVVGKAGNTDQSLADITSRIDAGDYFDEDIQDVMDGMQMMKTKDLASQQDSDEVEEMGMDFERFLQGIESGDVIELEKDDD